MKKNLLEIFLVLCVLIFVFTAVYNSNVSMNVQPVEKTELFVMAKQQEQNGRNNTYYRLVDIHHSVVVDWVKDNQGNPFSYCRGLVLIGKKRGEMELFDCRNGQKKLIFSKLELNKLNCRLLDIRPRYDNKNLVAIIMQRKNLQGFLGARRYVYDLEHNSLFLQEN